MRCCKKCTMPDTRPGITFDQDGVCCACRNYENRKIIAWVLSDTLEAKWGVEAVEKAEAARKKEKPRILHTDRGTQYACQDYVKATEGIQRSYSKKAYP